LVVVALLGIAGVLAYRSGVFSDDGGGATSTGGDDDAGGTTQAGGSAAGSAATGGASTEESEDADDADTGPAAIADEELVPDEERVVSLLEENGGRMKQVNIVEETGWSKSKVSMLLSDMEDEETISKLRVGRENIVSLAGHEPDAAGSPFDDEES
jgi:ubiquitin